MSPSAGDTEQSRDSGRKGEKTALPEQSNREQRLKCSVKIVKIIQPVSPPRSVTQCQVTWKLTKTNLSSSRNKEENFIISFYPFFNHLSIKMLQYSND